MSKENEVIEELDLSAEMAFALENAETPKEDVENE